MRGAGYSTKRMHMISASAPSDLAEYVDEGTLNAGTSLVTPAGMLVMQGNVAALRRALDAPVDPDSFTIRVVSVSEESLLVREEMMRRYSEPPHNFPTQNLFGSGVYC